MSNKPDEPVTVKTNRRRSIFFWVGRFLLYLILFFFSVLILIQLPPVQLWGAKKLSKSISKTLNTTVTIGGFNLHPLSDLSLTDVFVGSPNYPQDTLIKASTLNVDFHRLWSLLNNQLTVNQIIIDDGLLNIEKKAGDTLSNLDRAMLLLMPQKKGNKPPFVFDLDKISATSLQVNINDNTQGSLVQMIFERADISLDTLDMAGQYIKAEYMDFDEPLIYVTQKITEQVTKSSAVKSDKSWGFDIGILKWTNGKFYIDNQKVPHDTSQVYGIDYNHLVIADLDIEADSVRVRGMNMRGKDISIHVLHQNGFEIKTADADEITMSSEGINVSNLELETADSRIHNSIEVDFSGFDDFKSFADSVVFIIPQADISLHMKDLLAIMPSLGKIDFISDNRDKSLVLRGNVNGHVNRLRILDMTAGMGGLSLSGDFRSRDLAIKGSQLLSLDLDRASFSAAALKDIFPRMKVPPVLNRLGQVSFTGKFDGYPDDFVAYGNFNTALGGLTLDMNLNVVQGISNARYSGTISMDDFNLGAFLGNKDLGRTSMTGRVIEGKGLTMESIEADITAVMSYVVYQGYTYRNARLDGQISGRLFSGTMDINDPNVDMHFEGVVDYTNSSPKFDFVARLDSIRFLPLGFGSKPIAVSGFFDVDLTAGSFNDFRGTIYGEDVTVRINDVNYKVDSLMIDAIVDSVSGDRFYHIRSDVMSGVVNGVFDPLTLKDHVHQYLHKHYPSTIGPPKKIVSATNPVRVAWDIKVHDSGIWLDIAGVPGLVIKNAYTHGNLNLTEEIIAGFIDLPELHYAGVNVYGTSINFDENSGKLNADLEVIAADIKENLFFEDVAVQSIGTDDSLRVRIQTDHIAEIIDELDVEILADPEEGTWSFSINPIKLEMLGDSWLIPAGNLVQIRDKSFSLENFELVSGDRRIVVDDINNKGVEAFITGFDVNYLNTLWLTDKFDFSGTYTLDLEVDNIYDIKQMSTVLHVPALKINNQPYGEWIINGSMQDPKDSVKLDIVMNNNEAHLTGKGAFLPPIKSIPKEKHNYLRLALEATEFPLDFLEFLLGGNIRDTEGSVDLSLSLEGPVNRLTPNGHGKVYNGSTTIDYLGTAYSFHDQSFKITESMIDLSGTELYDVQGNVAYVDGGITHRYLKNLGIDATLTSDRIIGLDVTSEENASFYGFGIGSIFARFTGSIANMNMFIDVRNTAKGTHIYIPLSSGVTTSDRDFVVFLENGQLPADKLVPFNLGGISLTMSLNVTPDAIVEIIFDDNTGEVLQAIGEGGLTIEMTRTGNISLVGKYTISEGDYLFTNFFIKKPFEILPDSWIEWTGNPYDAIINVRANYKGLTATVKPLIEEYLTGASADVISDANTRTRVDLTMILEGSLLKPDISFDVQFPDLSGSIKGFVDSRINLLKANQNALMEQVVALLFSRSFVPPLGLGTSTITQGLSSSLTEYIVSTLSSYLSGLLGDIIPEGQILSGVGFDANITLPQDVVIGGTIDESFSNDNSTDIRLLLPLEFFNDRVSLTVGGNYVTGSQVPGADNYFAGDVAFEYKITPDGWLRIRAYNRTTGTLEGRKNKTGVGLAFRKEYDSFSDIFGRKKKKKDDTPPAKVEETLEEVEGG